MNQQESVVMAEQKTPAPSTTISTGITTPPAQPVRADINLRPIEGSDRPLLANLTSVQTSMDMVLVDFGFLEPQTINAIAQAGRTGAKLPDALTGQLASRVAMNLQTASQLAQQLNELFNRVRQQQAAAMPKAADAPAKP
jgi:hypothetical protein